ncbi:MAG: LysR family transcriptional regulator [Xanthobacteraceae bacterium]
MQWTGRVRQRVKLRDLYILLAVAEHGSILRAAKHLAVSHPVVSRTISELELALGVRLFDRGARGVETTMHGQAAVDCSVAVFDELRRGMQHLEYLSDPTVDEVRIGATPPLMAGLIPAVIARVGRDHPRISFYSAERDTDTLHKNLRQRQIDFVISRRRQFIGRDDLFAEELFDEQLFVVVGRGSTWARRRKIDLSELVDEPWILPLPDGELGKYIVAGFHSRGLSPPKKAALSDSIPLRNKLLATNRYISVLPRSLLHFCAQELAVKVLPVTIPGRWQPAEIVTLKNRTLSPAAEVFIDCVRDLAKDLPKVRG